MAIRIELTYDMAKSLGGEPTFEIEAVGTVDDAVAAVRDRFATAGNDFEKLSRVASVAVNGVLTRYKKGNKTVLHDGDVIAFVKAAAGG